jgi:methyl-accepting chemotaxis protein
MKICLKCNCGDKIEHLAAQINHKLDRLFNLGEQIMSVITDIRADVGRIATDISGISTDISEISARIDALVAGQVDPTELAALASDTKAAADSLDTAKSALDLIANPPVTPPTP